MVSKLDLEKYLENYFFVRRVTDLKGSTLKGMTIRKPFVDNIQRAPLFSN